MNNQLSTKVVTNEGAIIPAHHDRPDKIDITRENCDTVSDFEHYSIKNSDGSPARARRNGKTKTWKTRPTEFRIPVKYGLKVCFYITQATCKEWYALKIGS